jgi:hypothetical protein
LACAEKNELKEIGIMRIIGLRRKEEIKRNWNNKNNWLAPQALFSLF